MARLVAVGDRAFVVALAGIGAEPMRCDSPQAFEEALRRLAVQKDVHLVFVAEPLAEAVPEAVAAFRSRSSAALVALPLVLSEEHPSLLQVRYLIEQATGARLI